MYRFTSPCVSRNCDGLFHPVHDGLVGNKKSEKREGGVAQMVSALVCHTKGRGFKSPLSRQIIKNMGLILALLERVQNV